MQKENGTTPFFSPWSSGEEKAFKDFPHANDLAEALYRRDETGTKAFMAMESVMHIASHQVDWIREEGHFLLDGPPIHIVRQEFFEQDFAKLMEKLPLKFDLEALNIATDARSSHSNNYENVPELSPLAREDIKNWYAQDFELYRLCSEWCENSR